MDLVTIQNNQVLTSSTVVATVFGKQHKHVIRDVEVLISNMNALKNDDGIEPKFGLYSETEQNQLEFNQSNNDGVKTEVENFFIESKYKAPNGKTNKCYLMTRDGFSLLVMGFTGQKALEWKLKYIEAFNYMEESIMKVNELDITNSEEWRMLKGSAKSIVHIDTKLKDKMKEIEKILRSIEDDRFHIQIYGDQVLKMADRMEKGMR